MKDSRFDEIWQQQVLPFLKKYDDERRKAQLWYLLVFVAFVGLMPVFINIEFGLPNLLVYLGGFVGLTSIVSLFLLKVDYVSKFKAGVAQGINQVVDFHWLINKDGQEHVNSGKKLLEKSGLYHGWDDVIVRDQLTATVGEETVVEAYKVQTERESDEERKAAIPIFHGFIARVPVSNSFGGETYVQTEADSSFIDYSAGGLFDNKTGIKKIELEWGEFEQFLAVKSSSPAEARRVFTPDFMAVLYDWWRDHGKELRISFRGNSVYIGWPTDIRLDPNLLSGVENEKESVRGIIEFVLMLEGLVKILKENR